MRLENTGSTSFLCFSQDEREESPFLFLVRMALNCVEFCRIATIYSVTQRLTASTCSFLDRCKKGHVRFSIVRKMLEICVYLWSTLSLNLFFRMFINDTVSWSWYDVLPSLNLQSVLIYLGVSVLPKVLNIKGVARTNVFPTLKCVRECPIHWRAHTVFSPRKYPGRIVLGGFTELYLLSMYFIKTSSFKSLLYTVFSAEVTKSCSV